MTGYCDKLGQLLCQLGWIGGADRLVYELYDLTDEEIKIVAGGTSV